MKRIFKKLITISLATAMIASVFAVDTVSAKTTTPKKTTIKSITSVSKSQIKLSWKKVSTVKGYIIYRKTGKSAYKQIKKITSKSKTTYTDSKLKANTTYSYKIKTYKGSKKSKYSNVKSTSTWSSAINLDTLGTRAYELKVLMGQSNFTSPSAMSVNAIVEFAFCHIYYENLRDMPTTGMTYRSATATEIQAQIKKYFGIERSDITESMYYNKGKDLFEMFQPKFSATTLFTTNTGTKTASNTYKISSTFYSDSQKKTKLSSATLTVKVSGSNVYIQSIK